MSKNHNNAKFTFFYLLSLVALGFTAVSAGIITFQIINKMIPGVDSSFVADAMRFGISAIIIATPVYYVMMRNINKNLKSGELEHDSAIRKWLTYLIIFASSVTVIGWLISVINVYLNGEMTLSFILKALTVLIISGLVFGYYFYDIKRETIKKKDCVVRKFFLGSLILILAAFITGLCISDSPQTARFKKNDNIVLRNFESINGNINQYFERTDKLPESLDILLDDDIYYLRELDVSQEIDKKEVKYQYNVIDRDNYELCATFKLSNKDLDEEDRYSYMMERWSHDAGHQCLKKKVVSRNVLRTKLID